VTEPAYGARPLNQYVDPSPGMLHLDADEWALLRAVPEFGKFLDQLTREYEEVKEAMACRALLDADSAERTALNYAVNCGRLDAIREIITYRPLDDTADPE